MNAPESNKKRRRIPVEWVLLIAFVLFLRYTDTGTVVQGWMQRGVLATGLFSPKLVFDESEAVPADLDIELVAPDGRRLNLSEYRGKVIFINLWATWCAPCLAEMPSIQDLHDRIDHSDIAFVLISSDDNWEEVRRFVDARELTVPVYRPVEALPTMFDTGTIPTTWVVRPDGKRLVVRTGMANYDSDAFRDFLMDLSDSPRP